MKLAWKKSDTENFRSALEAAQKSCPPDHEKIVRKFLLKVAVAARAFAELPIEKRRKEVKRLSTGRRRTRMQEDPIRRVIEWSADDDMNVKKKIKYANTVRWVEENGIPRKKVRQFIRENGGVKGCDAKYRNLKRQNSK